MHIRLCLLFGVLAIAQCVSAAPTGPAAFAFDVNFAQSRSEPATDHRPPIQDPSFAPPPSSHLLLPRGRIGDKIRGSYQVASMFLPRITGRFSRKDAVGVMKHVGKKAGKAGKGVVSYAAGKVIRTMGGRRYARVRRRSSVAEGEGEAGKGRERLDPANTL